MAALVSRTGAIAPRAALRLEAKYPSQCLRLCYEELVTVTDTVTGAVFRFLNEEPVANVARLAWTELHDDGPSTTRYGIPTECTLVPSDRVAESL